MLHILFRTAPNSDPFQVYCKNILRKHPHRDRIICRICSTSIFWKRSMGGVLDHVRAHFGKELCQCKFCDHKAVTRKRMGLHIRKCHRRSGSVCNFNDFSKDHLPGLMEMFDQCFNGKKAICSLASANSRCKIWPTGGLNCFKRENLKTGTSAAGFFG